MRFLTCLSVIFVSSLFSLPSWAEEFIITTDKALLYTSPDHPKSSGYLKKGQRVQKIDEQGDFIRIKTKSGRPLWIRNQDLNMNAAADVESGTEESSRGTSAESDFKRWSFSLSFASGSYNGKSYSEAHLGIGYMFLRWLQFHNSLFSSLTSDVQRSGVDTSMRAILNAGFGGFTHIHAFAGPGYRFASNDGSVPFAEAGLITSLAGFSIGGSVKTFFWTMKDSRLQNQNQYSIILAGGTSF